MTELRGYVNKNLELADNRIRGVTATLVLTVVLFLTPAGLLAATDVSKQVSVTHTGYGRNRATGVWTSTMSVTNTSQSAIPGPVNVVLTNLSSNATMVNKTGVSNGSPYITVTAGTLAPGTSVSVSIQFTNPSNDFINFTPITYSGGSL